MKVYVLNKESTDVDIGESCVKVVGVYTDYDKAKEDFEKEKIEVRKQYEKYGNDIVERQGYKGDTWVIEEKDNYFMLHTVLQIRIAHTK